MKKWLLFTTATTDLYLHPAMLLYALYAVMTGHGMYMLLSTISIMLHEGAHAACAVLFRKPPGSIELTPLGAVMHLEDEVSLPPLKRAVMVLAGPLLTLLLCYFAYISAKHRVLPLNCARALFLCNLSILLLNLIPALPLDGGRFTALLLEMILPMPVMQRVMQWTSTALGICMIMLNLFASWKLGSWNLSLAFAGCCLIYCASVSVTTNKLEELRHFLDRKIQLERKGSQHTLWISSLTNVPLKNLIKQLPPNKLVMYICVEPGSMNTVGWLSETDIIQQYMRTPEISVKETLSMYPSHHIRPNSDTN